MPKYSLKGVPDIICVYKRCFVGLEVKRPGNELSGHQEAFRDSVQAAGGFYFTVTCLEDVIKAFKSIDACITY